MKNKSFAVRLLVLLLVGLLVITGVTTCVKKNKEKDDTKITPIDSSVVLPDETPTETTEAATQAPSSGSSGSSGSGSGQPTIPDMDLFEPEGSDGTVMIASHYTEGVAVNVALADKTGDGKDDAIRYAFVVDEGMKPNTDYVLTWIISDDINTVYYGINLMYKTPGYTYPQMLEATGSANLYANSIEFTTDASENQYLHFYVAEGDYDEDTLDYSVLAAAVKDCVRFYLYELVEA